MALNATRPIRLSANFVHQAEQEASLLHRSIAGQVEHWARIGQAFETAPGYTLDRVKLALAARYDADKLDATEREYFDEALGDALGSPSADELAFFEERRRTGVGVGYDDHGQLVRALPDGGAEALTKHPAA